MQSYCAVYFQTKKQHITSREEARGRRNLWMTLRGESNAAPSPSPPRRIGRYMRSLRLQLWLWHDLYDPRRSWAGDLDTHPVTYLDMTHLPTAIPASGTDGVFEVHAQLAVGQLVLSAGHSTGLCRRSVVSGVFLVTCELVKT